MSNNTKLVKEVVIKCSPSPKEAEWIKFQGKPNIKVRLITKGIKIDGNEELITDWSEYEKRHREVSEVDIDGILHIVIKPSSLKNPYNKIDSYKDIKISEEGRCAFNGNPGEGFSIKMFSPNDPNPEKYQYVGLLEIICTNDEKKVEIEEYKNNVDVIGLLKNIGKESADEKISILKNQPNSTLQNNKEQSTNVKPALSQINNNINVIWEDGRWRGREEEPEVKAMRTITEFISGLTKLTNTIVSELNMFALREDVAGKLHLDGLADEISVLASLGSEDQRSNLEKQSWQNIQLMFGLYRVFNSMALGISFQGDEEKQKTNADIEGLRKNVYPILNDFWFGVVSTFSINVKKVIKQVYFYVEKQKKRSAKIILSDLIEDSKFYAIELDKEIEKLTNEYIDVDKDNIVSFVLNNLKEYRKEVAIGAKLLEIENKNLIKE